MFIFMNVKNEILYIMYLRKPYYILSTYLTFLISIAQSLITIKPSCLKDFLDNLCSRLCWSAVARSRPDVGEKKPHDRTVPGAMSQEPVEMFSLWVKEEKHFELSTCTRLIRDSFTCFLHPHKPGKYMLFLFFLKKTEVQDNYYSI